MALFIILIILGLVITIIAAFYGDDLFDKAVMTVLSAIFCASVGLLILIIANAIGNEVTKKENEVSFENKIVSLSDGTGVKGNFSGAFFISRGSVNDTQHFSYYFEDNGGYSLMKRPAENSKIFLDGTSENSYVTIYDKEITCEETWYSFGCTPRREFSRAEFHVPKGSIINEYELDAR